MNRCHGLLLCYKYLNFVVPTKVITICAVFLQLTSIYLWPKTVRCHSPTAPGRNYPGLRGPILGEKSPGCPVPIWGTHLQAERPSLADLTPCRGNRGIPQHVPAKHVLVLAHGTPSGGSGKKNTPETSAPIVLPYLGQSAMYKWRRVTLRGVLPSTLADPCQGNHSVGMHPQVQMASPTLLWHTTVGKIIPTACLHWHVAPDSGTAVCAKEIPCWRTPPMPQPGGHLHAAVSLLANPCPKSGQGTQGLFIP